MSRSGIWQLIPLLIISSSRVFSADNICTRMENYTVTSMETYTEPVIVNTFTWCLQIPPRCPKTRTEMRQRYRMKTELKTRSVNECCEGYKMISSNDQGIMCTPFCEKCLSGTCVSPNRCQCIPGFRGDNCETICTPGKWGSECKEKCNCVEDIFCNPVNGQCVCPPGLHGKMCNESCPGGREECDYPRNMKEEIGKAAMNFTSADRETTESRTEDTREAFATTNNPGKTTKLETTSNVLQTVYDRLETTSDQTKIRTQEDGNPSTARPVIVLVSVPERRRNFDQDRKNFVMNNPFMRHVDDNDLHDVVGPPKIDYVKNIHKDIQPAPIPLDIALIVVASIISLGLTSVAVVMVLHMRSKLLGAARISVYEEGKTNKQENSNQTKISSIVHDVLPPTPLRLGPLFVSPEHRTILTTNNIDSSNNYANGAATIGLRLSGNLQDFLRDDHYDRPPATRIHLQSDFDANTEHVYDEIPLQSNPFGGHKNA